jgi:hypothetical protein
MIDLILVITTLSLGAILYVVLRNRVDKVEEALIKQEAVNAQLREGLIKMAEHMNVLTNAHNEVADVLNAPKPKQEEMPWDDYTPWKTPKGEA